MIGRDLATSRDRGEVADILIAAEYPIYGRFGYGPAVASTSWELVTGAAHDVRRTRARGPCSSSTTRRTARRRRRSSSGCACRAPGMIRRDDLDWDVHADIRRYPRRSRGRASGCSASTTTASPRATRRTPSTGSGRDMRPQSIVELSELVAATAGAEARLWRFVAELDLVAAVKAGDRPTDEALPWLLENGRLAKQVSSFDFMWVRPLDVARLLTTRTYERDGPHRVRRRRRPRASPVAGSRSTRRPTGRRASRRREAAELTFPVKALGRRVARRRRPCATLLRAGWLDEHVAGAAARAGTLLALRSPRGATPGSEPGVPSPVMGRGLRRIAVVNRGEAAMRLDQRGAGAARRARRGPPHDRPAHGRRAHGDVRAGGRRGGAARRHVPRPRRPRARPGRGAGRRGVGRAGASSPSGRSSPSSATGSGSRSSGRARTSCASSATRSAPSCSPRRPTSRSRRGVAGRSRRSSRHAEHAGRIGYPLMIKATAGGGGRGIRRVDDEAGLAEAFDSARSEGLKAFGDATVFMERVVTGARHVEVQLIADEHGTAWAVGVRDCSMQRRNQKVIEESQCTVLTPEQDRDLRAGRGAAGRGRRLRQRGHRRVPLPAGRAALRVPRGQHAPAGRAPGHRADDRVSTSSSCSCTSRPAGGWRGSRRRPSGYAIEARLNAEDPQRAFAPAPGTIEVLTLPVGPGHPRRHGRRRRRRDPARVRLDDRQGHRRRPRSRRGAVAPAPRAVADDRRRRRRHDEPVVPARPAGPAGGASRRRRHVVARPPDRGRRAPADAPRRRRPRRRGDRRVRARPRRASAPRSSAGPSGAARRPTRRSGGTVELRHGGQAYEVGVRQLAPDRFAVAARRRPGRRACRAPRSAAHAPGDRRRRRTRWCRRTRAPITSSRSTASPTGSPATTPASCGRRRRPSSSGSTSRPGTSSRTATGSASSRR